MGGALVSQNAGTAHKNGRQITLDHFFNNFMCEKLHIKFGKFLEFIEKPYCQCGTRLTERNI